MNRVDVKCRICLSILIKPVILPCTHEFCLECLEKHLIQQRNCPLCRLRVSTWARLAKKNNSFVNEIRWQTIKKNFPHRVNKRLNNLETSSDTEADSDIEMIMDKKKTLEHLKTKDKEVMDKLQGADLSSHLVLNAAPRVSSADKPGCSGVTKPCSQSTTTLEPPKQLPKRSASVESVDSISPELNHFRPIKSEPKTPPRRAPQEPIVLKPCTMIAKPRNLTADLTDDANSRSFPAPLTSLLPRWLHMSSADNSNKRSEPVNKSNSEKETERKEEEDAKTNKSAEKISVPSKGLKRRKRVESVVNENTVTMEKRRSTCSKRQQEMDDFKLALKIQRNINRGVYDVDRSCSGERPYFLRKRNPQSS